MRGAEILTVTLLAVALFVLVLPEAQATCTTNADCGEEGWVCEISQTRTEPNTCVYEGSGGNGGSSSGACDLYRCYQGDVFNVGEGSAGHCIRLMTVAEYCEYGCTPRESPWGAECNEAPPTCPLEQVWNADLNTCVDPEQGVWRTGTCSGGECGTGTRDVWCEGEDSGGILLDSACSGDKPTSSCQIGSCSSGDCIQNICVDDSDGPTVVVRSRIDGSFTSGLSVSNPTGAGLGGVTGEAGVTGVYTRNQENDVVSERLSAPSSFNGASFTGWENCNSDSSTSCWVSVLGTGVRTVTASYETSSNGNGGTPACTNNNDCPSPSSWSSWGSCNAPSAQCGEVTGVQSRSRTVYTCSGGSCVSSTETETRSCTVQAGSCGSGQFCSSNVCYDNLRIDSLTANPNEHQAPFSSQVAFSASGGRAPLSYSVNFGQGQSTSQSGHSTPLSDSYTRTYPAPATYTVSLSVSDSAGNSVSDSITVTAINTPPQITSFTATPEEFTASQTVTYTLTVQDASPYIDYEFTFSDSSTITGQSTNAGVNQPTTHTISVEYELPLHDLAASCSEVTLDPKDHLASVEVTDAFGLTHDDSISVTAHPIIDHETPAECVDHCDPDEAFFSDHTGEGACYHFGYVNTTLLFYETNPEGGIINVVMPIGATINLLHPVHQPIYPPVSYPSTGYYLHNPVIIGSYDIEATYLEVYHNSTSIEVERNQTTNTHLTFTERIYDENCTNEFGLCDRNAIGNNGCLVEEDYTDQELYEQQKRVLELCHPEGRNRGFEAGTLVIYERNQTHTTYASCCLDVLEPVETPRVEIETNATTLIRTQQQVMYRGRPVNLVITTFS